MKVAIPSRIKIQDQPALPPTAGLPGNAPIPMIPRARSPPKAPAAVAAEKKIAMRRPHSWRLYHIVMLRRAG